MTKKKKRETKELGTETRPGEGVMKEEKFPSSRKPFYWWVCGNFGISEGNITGRKKKRNTEYTPNRNSQWRSSPDAHVHHQRVGSRQGGMGCMLRVRTKPECPEDNLRELTLDSNPNCGIARERERERERTFW